MLIESLAQKTRLAMITVLATIGGCAVICGFTVWCCISLVNKERDQIYILDGNIRSSQNGRSWRPTSRWRPRRTSSSFISISSTCRPTTTTSSGRSARPCNMADGTALKQKQAMDENGFYSDIISSSAVCTVMCDSIDFDEQERKFTYYGTQLIKRRTRDLKRSLVTTGYVESVPRTRNNPHGLLITNWRTLENKDLDY